MDKKETKKKTLLKDAEFLAGTVFMATLLIIGMVYMFDYNHPTGLAINAPSCSNSDGSCGTNTCSAGFKCMNATARGYQQTDCSWIRVINCASGCYNGTACVWNK